MLRGFGPRFVLAALNPRSPISRALRGLALPHDETRLYARNLESPSGGGVGTARAIARAYSVFATAGRELGLSQATLDHLAAPAIPPARGFHDECLKSDNIQFSVGFMKSTTQWPFGSASAFGAPGSGGALGFADPTSGIGYAYVTSQMGTRLTGDPRDVSLREALDAARRALSRLRLVAGLRGRPKALPSEGAAELPAIDRRGRCNRDRHVAQAHLLAVGLGGQRDVHSRMDERSPS